MNSATWTTTIGWPALVILSLTATNGCGTMSNNPSDALASYDLDDDSTIDAGLQSELEGIDWRLRHRYEMEPGLTAVGLLDLRGRRLAMIHPDQMDYAASVPKIGILLAYFQLHPEQANRLDPHTRHELGLMIKISSNEMAAKYSRHLGLHRIQEVLNSYHFYDTSRGGIWMGKHYGRGEERYGDPIGDNSHAATVRQLLRFYLLIEQGRLVSPEASATMREIFASPDIPHDPIKFVKGLAGRNVEILRKSGTWMNWLHDTAIVTGPGRHYIVVGMTRHPQGDDYLVDFAGAVDDLLTNSSEGKSAL
jgi:beta-lactamase class A